MDDIAMQKHPAGRPFRLKRTVWFVGCALATILLAASVPAQSYRWSTIAGNAGYGSADGTNSDARFWAPIGIAADNRGNLYVSDYRNNTIRQLTPVGTNWVVNTIAGAPASPGANDGLNGSARFESPRGVAVDAQGNVYVADSDNYTVRKLTPMGTNWMVSTIAGRAKSSGYADGMNSNARFTSTYDVATDIKGNVYVADRSNNTIRKLTPVETNWVVTTIAGRAGYSGSTDGTNSKALFSAPSNLALDQQGNIYVTDSYNFTIRKLTAVGTNWVVTTIAGKAGASGTADGTNSAARFHYPGGLAVDSSGNVMVADSHNQTLRYLTPQGTNWVVSTIAGLAGYAGDADGTNRAARFYSPSSVTAGANGIFYVTDCDNYCIRSLALQGTNWVVGTIAGTSGPGSRDGMNNEARFFNPNGIGLDDRGNVFVADTSNETIRKLTPSGTNWVVSTVAGLVGYQGNVDGTNSEARLGYPEGVAADAQGNLFVPDLVNHSIRKLTCVGTDWIVTTPAGGVFGSADGTNQQAQFWQPAAVAADSSGANVFVADEVCCTIRRMTLSGSNWIVTTIAGTARAEGSIDGTNKNSRFNWPGGIAADNMGNLFVTDSQNFTIRKLTPFGTNWVSSTIAGQATQFGSMDGTNSTARFSTPIGIAADRAGNLYVADQGNHTIRKVTPVGTNWVVSTVGGSAGIAGSTDGIGSQARFAAPRGIAVDCAGNLFVADMSNNSIRMGVPIAPAFQAVAQTNGSLVFSWNSTTGLTYQVQYKAALTQDDWINLSTPVTATNSTLRAFDTITSEPQRFYRVILLP